MALREIIARFGFQVDQAGLKQAQSGIGGVIGNLRTFGAVLAGSAVVRGLQNFVRDVVQAGDELGKTAAQLGVGVRELQAWQKAAQFSGASTQEFNTGLRTFAKNALLAQQGSKQAKDAFGSLGVEIEDSGGNLKENTVLMREAGLALGKLENNTERVALAQQLFGRAGTKLLPLFAKTNKELDELLGRVDELGGGFSENAVKLAEETADAFLDLDIATDSLKSTLAEELLPRIRDSARGFAEWLGGVVKSGEAINTLKSIVTVLGIVLGRAAIAKFGGSLLQLGRSALIPLAKFVLLFLVIDDLIALFEGRGSVIGAFLDKIFGKGSAKLLVKELKSIGSALIDLAFNFGNTSKDADGFITDNETRFTKFASALASSTDQIVKDFAEAWEFAKKDIGAFVDSALLQIAQIPEGIVDLASDALTAAVDFGKSIIDGVIKGIKDGAQDVADALGDAAKSAIDGAAKLIGANSPSRLSGDKIGEPTIEGVVTRMRKLAGPASQQAAAALQTASGLSRPSVATAPARGGAGVGGGAGGGTNLFKSEMNITVNGGSASDPQIQKLRQGVRSELRDNRRATLDALTQRVEAG